MQLELAVGSIPFDADATDTWHSIWGGDYTSKKFYTHAYQVIEADPIYKIIWKSSCTARIKFFIWLLLVDRLNTKTMLTRRHIHVHEDNLCVLCDSDEEETIDHLFFTCPFATQCWNRLGFTWDNTLNLGDRIVQARNTHNMQFFMEASMIAAWELWKMRNDKIFDR